MKSVEEWLQDGDCLVRSKLGISGRIDAEGIRQIQSDAYAQGMTDAAIIAQSLGPCSGTPDWNNSRNLTMKQAADAILSARDQKGQ